MSNKKKPQQPAGPGGSSRSRGAAMMQQQRTKEKRRNALIQAGIAVAAVVAVLLVTVAVLNARSAGVPELVPQNISSDGTYSVGSGDTTIRVVEDLQCPVCKQFEEQSGDTLRQLAADGDATVEYQGVAFLDRASSTEYSSRALNAWACVADESDSKVWQEFQQQMYAQQPEEGGAGLTDDQITKIAVDAGADEGTVGPCIADRKFADWVTYTTDQAREDPDVDGTPTVFVDDEVSQARTPDQLRAAVDQS